jgi:hypothetical protein
MTDNSTDRPGPPLLPGATGGNFFPPESTSFSPAPQAFSSPPQPGPTGAYRDAGGGALANADGEHNTAALKRILADIGSVLHRGTDTINSLNRRNGALVGQVADAGEFAVATEQSDRSKRALDETSAVTASMDQHLGGMSTAVAAAEDAVSAAIGGLKVVDEAEDDLRQSGAGPKSVAPARDGA